MIEVIFKNLIKRKIIVFSKMEESFYLYTKLEKKIKLSEEIIKINYRKESPFPEEKTMISSISEDNHLYLWFYKGVKKQRYLPEGLVLFRTLGKDFNNVICIFKGVNNHVLIIKNKILVASFVKRTISDYDILLMKDEYSVEEVQFFNTEDYTHFIDNSLSNLKYNDLLNILNIQIDFKKFLNAIIRWSALPLLISIIILAGMIGGYNFYRESQNDDLLNRFKSTTKDIHDIRTRVNRNEELNRAFTSLMSEFKYIDKSLILSQILEVSKDLNMTLEYVRMDAMNVDFAIITLDEEKIPLYTTKLFESNLFDDVKNISSQRIGKVSTKATMKAKLKVR